MFFYKIRYFLIAAKYYFNLIFKHKGIVSSFLTFLSWNLKIFLIQNILLGNK